MVKHCSLKTINVVTVGTEWPRPRMCNICSSPKYVVGGWKIQYPLSVNLKGTMGSGRFNLIRCERSGLEPTVRIDICERTILNHFAIKVFYTSWNDNWIQNGLILYSKNNQFGTVGTEWPRPRIHNIWSSPKYSVGVWNIQYPLSVCLKGTMSSGRLNLIPRQDSNPRSELTFVRQQC